MTTLSKEEYLKRYLQPADSSDYKKKKKKRKEKVKISRGMKIVDDDVSWNSIAPKGDEADDFPDALLTQEEKPQVEVIDNRTEEEKVMDGYRKSNKWKSLNKEEDDVANAEDSESDMDDVPRRRHDSDSDLDVQRSKSGRSRKRENRKRHDSDSDLDVKRNYNKSSKSVEESDSDLDIRRSNQREKSRKHGSMGSKNGRNSRGHQRHDSSDLNIPRSKGERSNVKTSKRDSSESDLELPRNKKAGRDSDSDLEIPRKTSAKNDSEVKGRNKSSKHARHDSSSEEDVKATAKRKALMSSGGVGGLTSRDDLKREIEERKKKESEIDKLAKDTRKNKTVYREKGGKKRDLNKEREAQEAEDKEKRRIKEKYDKWGQGIVQDEMKTNAIGDLIHESNKPLARYADDKDLDALQRSQVRDGDPMAEYIARKKRKEESNAPAFPKYRGPAPAPNRFHIQPGYRWDGVNRSNGFEKKYYESLSDRTANKQDAYKWSVEDM